MYVKKLVSLILIFVLSLPFYVVSTTALSQEEVLSPSAVLMEPNTRKILFEKNAHEQRPCASITKVMTLLLVMEAIEDGKIAYDDIVTTSEHAKSMGGSDIWLEVGEQMSVHDMIKAVTVASANDAAVALAEHICGTEDEFVAKMNERAKQLGMKNTVFKNCNGLDEEGHLTTAYDVALMSSELIKHEKIFEYTTIWLDYLRNGETQIVNTNKLLRTYNGITGLKTGTTGQAGSCITATATRDNLSLVSVVLGSESGTQRFKDASVILDYGFASFEVLSFDSSVLKQKSAPVKNGMSKEVMIECKGADSLIIDKGTKANIEHSIKIDEELCAPIKKGQKVGSITYTFDGNKICDFEITAIEDVRKTTFSSVMSELFSALVAL